MSDVTFTKLGHGVFHWERLLPCTIAARYLWIALYGSPRRVIPGLWVGGMPTFGDVAKMQPDDVIPAMDNLLEHELVEFDRKREVLRLTEFPDRCDRPDNGKVVRGIYNRFRVVPDCDIRNAHVETLLWLIDDPSRPPTEDHVKAWSDTFGKVTIPAPRKRGVRRLLDSDTSNPNQVSLFASPGRTVSPITKPDTVCDTVSDTVGSRIKDLGSDLSDLGESKVGARLGLVPLSADPFTTTEMLDAIASSSAGRFSPGPVDERSQDALHATIRACVAAEVGLPALRTVGAWLAAGGLSYRTDLGPPWVTKPGELLNAVGQAATWASSGGGEVGASSRRPPARAEPAPIGVHGTGRRQL